jgi:hypothetical protein
LNYATPGEAVVPTQEACNMKEMFTFENLPLTFIIGLIVVSWLSFFSVILFA